ncbi:hypothetical protein HK096_004920, partial [Nowakowskiella sp. JEL0078]
MADPKPPILRNIIVLGAGVQGLSVAWYSITAVSLLRAEGHNVTIVAKGTPECPDADELYTSPKAGANWQSYASAIDLRLQSWDEITFRVMWRISGSRRISHESGIRRTEGLLYFPEKPKDWRPHWFGERGVTPNYMELENVFEFPEGAQFGVGFETLLVDANKFIKYLSKKFLDLGGAFALRQVDSLSDLYNGESEVDIVINCAGFGSRTLGDVMDESVVPGRGQIVIVYAPHIKKTISMNIGENFGD